MRLRKVNNCPGQRWTEVSLPLRPWFSLPCNSSSIPEHMNNLTRFLEIQILGHQSQRFWSNKFVHVAENQHLWQTAEIILKQMLWSLPLRASECSRGWWALNISQSSPFMTRVRGCSTSWEQDWNRSPASWPSLLPTTIPERKNARLLASFVFQSCKQPNSPGASNNMFKASMEKSHR